MLHFAVLLTLFGGQILHHCSQIDQCSSSLRHQLARQTMNATEWSQLQTSVSLHFSTLSTSILSLLLLHY